MKRIFLLEKELTWLLAEYSQRLKDKLNKIQEYLLEVESSLSDKSESDKSDEEYFERISGNPIHAYKLVKRFSVDWKRLEPEVMEDDWSELELKITKKKLSTIIPKERDLHGSAQALLRISDVYDLDIRKLSDGILESQPTSAKLSAKDCLFMGKHSFNSGELSRSLEWFEMAWMLAGQNSSISRDDVKDFIEYASEEHDLQVSKGETNSKKVFPLPVHQVPPFEQRDLLRKRGGGVQKKKQPLSEEEMFKSLCRGEEHREASELRGLKCRLSSESHPYYLLHPVMVEDVSKDPFIVMYHDVVSPAEMKTIKEIAEPHMMRSQVQSEKQSEVSKTRTSKTGWLQDSFHPIVSGMNFKVRSITGLQANTWREDAELLQIATYINGGHYQPHHDYVHKGTQPDKMIYGNTGSDYFIGDRIATWMVYMNEVTSGGRTVFPRLGLGVEPTPGAAVFWYNLKKSGRADERTLHGACPILLGSKWVGNKWIREGGQIFVRPCGLSQSQ
eukprot:TRINITY_DN6888_c0_g1_i4.p1 TRINITY_DN6888_c0_g1~~TRINITY_DN6888_c0_g1_i4.p1  ORF type:complete len:543 (-),score=113.79 TRINITY_DN6888_c0_g1_i4:996-2501(-)